MIKIFAQNWYQKDGETPHSNAPKKHIKYVDTEEEARAFCRKWNAEPPPSWIKVSRKYCFKRT